MNSASDALPDAGGWTPRLVLSFLSMVMLLELLACSYIMLAIALPDISREFSTGQGIWLMTSFLLVSTVASPLVGKLADTHGKRRLLLISVVLSAFGATVAALAPSFVVLLAGWSVVGLLSPCIFLVYSLIRDVYPARTVPLAVSLSTTGMGLIAIPAPVLAGYIIDGFGWRGVFWFCASVLFVLVILIRVTTEESPVRLSSRLDLVGSALLAGGLTGVLLALSMGSEWGWTSAQTLITAGLGLAGLAAWYVSARVISDPLIDLDVLLQRSVFFTTLSSGMVWAVVATFTVMLPMMVMIPAEAGLGYGFGLSSGEYSWVQVPMGVCTLLAGFLVGGLVSRGVRSRFSMITGLALTAVGCAGMAFAHSSLIAIAVWVGIVGLGTGMGYAATPNLLIEAVPPRLQATAGGIASTSGNLFPAVLPVVVFAVLNGSYVAVESDGAPLYSDLGITVGFTMCAVGASLGLAAAVALPGRRRAGVLDGPAVPEPALTV